MSEKISVQMIFEQTVRYEAVIEMTQLEYDDHFTALNSGNPVSRMRGETLFEKYFDPKVASDYSDPDLIEFSKARI